MAESQIAIHLVSAVTVEFKTLHPVTVLSIVRLTLLLLVLLFMEVLALLEWLILLSLDQDHLRSQELCRVLVVVCLVVAQCNLELGQLHDVFQIKSHEELCETVLFPWEGEGMHRVVLAFAAVPHDSLEVLHLSLTEGAIHHDHVHGVVLFA